MRCSLNTLLISILVLAVFPFHKHRPDRLLTAARSIDHIVQDSLVVNKRDHQCYITICEKGFSRILVPVRVRQLYFGKRRNFDLAITYLTSLVRIMDRSGIDYVETTSDYIFGATEYYRKGCTVFLYLRRDMDTKATDSVFRSCYLRYAPHPLSTIEGDGRFRYVTVP